MDINAVVPSRIASITACLCLIWFAALPAQAQNDTALTMQVDACMKDQLQSQHIPGATVAIVKGGKLLLAKGYGLASVELSVPATDRTVYEIGSMTKQFTAAAILQLVEEGKLHLDDPISRYISDTPEAWSKITLRHLLNHTSGIKPYTSLGDFAALVRDPHTPADIVAMVRDLPLDFPIGTRWEYSNTGYYLLGMIIEKVSGKSYGEFLKERIFKPIGASVIQSGGTEPIIPRRASGYVWTGTQLHNGVVLQPGAAGGAGELVSDVYDLVKWDTALEGESLLKTASKEAMWTPGVLVDGTKTDYGFGWVIGNVRGHRLLEHEGGTAAFTTIISRYPDDRLTVIVLTNRAGSAPDKIGREIAGLVVPSLKPEVLKPITDSDTATTERLKKLLTSLTTETMSADEFTPDFYKRIETMGKQLRDSLVTLGPLQKLLPVEQTKIGEIKRYRYQAFYKETSLVISVQINADGKIAGMLLQPP